MFWPFTVWGFPKPIFKPHEYWLCKVCCCNSTYRLRYWNLVECTFEDGEVVECCNSTYRLRYWNAVNPCAQRACTLVLQQYLPFTVLKLPIVLISLSYSLKSCNSTYRLRYWNYFQKRKKDWSIDLVATVLTVYGIETIKSFFLSVTVRTIGCNSTYRLRYWNV